MKKTITRYVAAAALAIAAIPAWSQTTPPDKSLIASVVSPNNAWGVWEYSTTEWNPKKHVMFNAPVANNGGCAIGSTYYANTWVNVAGMDAFQTVSYDMADGWKVGDEYSGKLSYMATTMAYSPWKGMSYGCFYNEEGTGYNFVRWNTESYMPKGTICALERPWSACAFDSKNQLYAIERNGDLYKVDTSTGAMTLVGSTGIESTGITDGAINPATDVFYWCVSSDTEHALYTVDLTTARATKLYDLQNEEELCGMAFVDTPELAAGAPAKPSVSLSFSGVNLAGKVAFYPPSRTVGGTTIASGTELTYTIYVDGKEYSTSTCTVGTRVNADVTVDKAGFYCITVICKNAAGESPKGQATKYIGPDTPKTPTTFSYTLDGTKVNLQWNSPSSTGVNGGNVDYSKAVYTVKRFPDGKIVADGITDRKVTDEITMPDTRTEYYYELYASVNGLNAAPAKSAPLSFGPIVAPAALTFDNAGSLAGYTVADGNEDNSKWVYYAYDKAARVSGSSTKGLNDWLITPPVVLEGATKYPVSIEVKNNSSSVPESVELLYGTEPTVEKMTSVIIEKTQLTGSAKTVLNGTLTTSTAGKVYIAVHGCTESRSSGLYLYNLTIGEGEMMKGPKPLTDLTATVPTDGTKKITLTFTLPTETNEGTAIEHLTNVQFNIDGDIRDVLDQGSIAPGKKIEWNHACDDLAYGKHTVSVIVATPEASTTNNVDITLGAGVPVAPENVTMIEEGESGKVKITWSPVDTDVDGNKFLPSCVTYKLIDREYNVIAEGLTECSYTVQAVPEGEQKFVQFGVYAVTVNGESKLAGSAYKPVGKAYDNPWKESFADGKIAQQWGYNYIKNQSPWVLTNDSKDPFYITPQDADGGFAYFEAYSGDVTAFVSPKISLRDLESPGLQMYVYNHRASQTNVIDVQADCGDGNGFVSVKEIKVGETGPEGQWNRVVVLFDELRDRDVVLRFYPKEVQLAAFAIDNLRIAECIERNLTASRLDAPTMVDAGEEFEITATVTNSGLSDMGRYTLELKRGGETVDSRDMTSLATDASANVIFAQTLTVADGESVEYTVEIVCNADGYEADNVSESVKVDIAAPAVPVATSLTGSQAQGEVTLSWTAPALGSIPAATTETFEGAQSWGQAVDGWKIIDADKAPFGGIGINNFPITGPVAWFVADRSWERFEAIDDKEAWDAHSGIKSIASGYAQRGNTMVQSDDWAISPRLYGGPQGIEFYAKSFQKDYLESLEVLYSTSTTSPDDFESLQNFVNIPASWTRMRVKLPDGAKYLALRARSKDRFFLFIDDVKFVPAEGEAAQLNLKGYNVYRDGVKLNTAPVTETTFTDTQAAKADASYFVTAVYDEGESRPSNVYTISLQGITDIEADGNGEAVYYNLQGVRIDNPAPGLYIEVRGGVSRKVLIKE